MLSVIQALGGLGLFLLGMTLMTDGLRSLAGAAIRKALMRFTHSPLSGAITGAVTTAVLQSSSATTVAAVGFVGAGMLGFSEALGIIFGANIGTTLKGWLVALLGFKVKLGLFALAFVLLGAVVRLFGRGRWPAVGYAVAGFGLIFVGVGFMQEGMADLQQIVTPAVLPADSIVGRLQLVAMGAIFTALTQSSSAGVAMALTALYAGAINFHQAAALVVGMDVGTTVTAALATIGGNVGSRRTGLSHVIYNCMTGLGAVIFITPYVALWEWLSPGALAANAEVGLVAFHTTFNTLGVIIVLPLTRNFARLIEHIIPDRLPGYTVSLNRALLSEPSVAMTAVLASARAELMAMLIHINALLGNTSMGEKVNLVELQQALDETHGYLDRIHLAEDSGKEWIRLVALIHALDHLQRLHDRCEAEDRATTAHSFPLLNGYRKTLVSAIGEVVVDIEQMEWLDAGKRAAQAAVEIHEQVEPLRDQVMGGVARGELDVQEASDALRAMRWMQRVSGHVAKVTGYLATVAGMQYVQDTAPPSVTPDVGN